MIRQDDKQEKQTTGNTHFWWKSQGKTTCDTKPPKPGDFCPDCGNGRLAYDGLFVLTCSACGKAAEAGAFT